MLTALLDWLSARRSGEQILFALCFPTLADMSEDYLVPCVNDLGVLLSPV